MCERGAASETGSTQISDHVERLVNLLKRDEGPQTRKDGEEIVAAATVEESDDEDMKIEEI